MLPEAGLIIPCSDTSKIRNFVNFCVQSFLLICTIRKLGEGPIPTIFLFWNTLLVAIYARLSDWLSWQNCICRIMFVLWYLSLYNLVSECVRMSMGRKLAWAIWFDFETITLVTVSIAINSYILSVFFLPSYNWAPWFVCNNRSIYLL